MAEKGEPSVADVEMINATAPSGLPADSEILENAEEEMMRKRYHEALAEPTDDITVRLRLRRLGEPSSLIGEEEEDRRHRLRLIFAELACEGHVEKLMSVLDEEEWGVGSSKRVSDEEDVLEYEGGSKRKRADLSDDEDDTTKALKKVDSTERGLNKSKDVVSHPIADVKITCCENQAVVPRDYEAEGYLLPSESKAAVSDEEDDVKITCCLNQAVVPRDYEAEGYLLPSEVEDWGKTLLNIPSVQVVEQTLLQIPMSGLWYKITGVEVFALYLKREVNEELKEIYQVYLPDEEVEMYERISAFWSNQLMDFVEKHKFTAIQTGFEMFYANYLQVNGIRRPNAHHYGHAQTEYENLPGEERQKYEVREKALRKSLTTYIQEIQQ